jgi:hypothetical protein
MGSIYYDLALRQKTGQPDSSLAGGQVILSYEERELFLCEIKML